MDPTAFMASLNEFLTKLCIWAIPVIFAITIHEVSHGWVANKYGDSTAKMLGRLTLNPLKHIDPIGTILIPTLLLMTTNFVFGWAKPVPVDHRNLRNPKSDMAIVAAAGPISNFIMALFWAGVLKIGAIMVAHGTQQAGLFILMGQAGVLVNLVLAILNLLPIPPLDGSRVVASVLPHRLYVRYQSIERYGFLILVALMLTGILGKIIGPPLIMFFKYILYVFQITAKDIPPDLMLF